MQAPIQWLLEGEPYIVYRTRKDLLAQPEDAPEVSAARNAMLAEPRVKALIAALSDWPGVVIASHKSAGQPFHRLTFLADLGVKAGDAGVQGIIKRILAHQSEEGPFQLTANIAKHYGGTGQDVWGWALCDAPLVIYALVHFGLAEKPGVRRAIEFLTGLVRDNGWPCAVSKELGNFRGPGRKEDPCPFASLAMLKALSAVEDLRLSPSCHAGAEALLSLWSDSLTRHPYIFYMGSDFRKIKVPYVWYDLMHVLEVLSHFPWVIKDPRFQDMLALLKSKADPQGCFTLESIWTAWKDWEFGQKKTPSRWLTLQAWKTIQRAEAG